MLTLFGKRDARRNHCDGLSRRHFLKVGGMAAGGLSLSQLLGLEARAGTGSSHKAIINIYLPGGPSHIDMFDMKPDAPSEIRLSNMLVNKGISRLYWKWRRRLLPSAYICVKDFY